MRRENFRMKEWCGAEKTEIPNWPNAGEYPWGVDEAAGTGHSYKMRQGEECKPVAGDDA